MGNKKSRVYLENFARTLMGQLEIQDGEVGVDSYQCDIIAAGIRQKLYKRVIQDMRHLQPETRARIVASFHNNIGMAEPYDQSHGEPFEALKSGTVYCTPAHVHYNARKNWLAGFVSASPLAILRHVSATIVVAAMYDIVVQKIIKQAQAIS